MDNPFLPLTAICCCWPALVSAVVGLAVHRYHMGDRLQLPFKARAAAPTKQTRQEAKYG